MERMYSHDRIKNIAATPRTTPKSEIMSGYSPKVIRASSSLMRFCSAGSEDALNRSASSRKRAFSASLESIPASMSSTRTRFALVACACASFCTRRASGLGMETLCRTVFWLRFIAASYTNMHHFAPAPRLANSHRQLLSCIQALSTTSNKMCAVQPRTATENLL